MFNKTLYSFFYLSLCVIFSIEAQQTEPLLILNMANVAALPRNFRTAQDPFKMIEEDMPSREGLETLRLSGSAQFSNQSLFFLLEHFADPSQIYIIDLRQESHGFINGEAVSWYGVKNWANVGKTSSEIQDLENQLLRQVIHKKTIPLATVIKKDPTESRLPTTTTSFLEAKWISNERELAYQMGVHYIRIPVTDHVRPTDENIDYLIRLVQHLPPSAWLHFHCAAGMGRTTTFMALIDIMKNAKIVSFEDIIQRQFLIGGLNLKKHKKSKRPWKLQLAAERLELLRHFYQYCQTNTDQFKTSWSLYLLQEKSIIHKPNEN